LLINRTLKHKDHDWSVRPIFVLLTRADSRSKNLPIFEDLVYISGTAGQLSLGGKTCLLLCRKSNAGAIDMSSNLSSNFLQFRIERATGNGHRTYEFDEFRLDAEKLMLYRSGHEILLPPKVIKTLAVLIEDSGEILSKDELLEKVWEGSIVEESNLSQYLYLL